MICPEETNVQLGGCATKYRGYDSFESCVHINFRVLQWVPQRTTDIVTTSIALGKTQMSVTDVSMDQLVLLCTFINYKEVFNG